MRQYKLLAAFALLPIVAACGGGGGNANTGSIPSGPEAPQVSATPETSPTPRAGNPTPSPGATASSFPTPAPGGSSARIPSTVGRIGLVQVFDYHNGYISSSQVDPNARKYDAVWASLSPTVWEHAHPGMMVSNYYIMGLDQYAALHHSLAWWRANHPSWILYACTSSGAPTHDIAYMQGINVPDMPLDIHNSQVVDYQVRAMASFAKAAGYNALAVDQVVFWNIYKGGNRVFGQLEKSGEYGCGAWNGGSFVRHYSSPTDPQYPKDVVAYVAQARSTLHSIGMSLVINHPGGSTRDPNEQALLANTDAVMNETGFSDYGRYQGNPGIVSSTLSWMRYAQARGTAVFVVDKFLTYPVSVSGSGLEYSIATYLLGNEGSALLFVGGAHGYGTLQYHPEYAAPVGTPCSDLSGGPVFERRFSGGIAVVNASLSTQRLSLPSGKSYRDVEGHAIGSSIPPMTGYVLLTGANGCS